MRGKRNRFWVPEVRSSGPMSNRLRHELRWIVAVIFAAGASLPAAPALAREVPFSAEQTITGSADGASSVVAADIDGDGDLDAVSASVLDDTIAWYENTDGSGTFGSEQVITSLADSAYSVAAADVDGDGDLDALSASVLDDTIAWYENTDGDGTFGSRQIINDSSDGASSVVAADVDGDGDLDVLSASIFDDTVAWYENTGGVDVFGSRQIITSAAPGAFTVVAADIDGDGDLDALSASFDDDTIGWYENTDGNGAFGSRQVISSLADGARLVVAADVDGDGDLDVLSTSENDDTVAWYENTDGSGAFGSRQIITSLADLARSVFVGDVDGDGDLDALSASFNDDTVAWYENETIHRGATFPQRSVVANLPGAQSVFGADIDGDGDVDVLSSSSFVNQIMWYENTDGEGAFGPPRGISITANGAQSVLAADVDGDGDLDALSALFVDNTIAWYENTDGSGIFDSRQVISSGAVGATSAFATDIDGDGDTDVLSASLFDDTIAWYENTDGNGTFGAQQVITNLADSARSVFAADVDGDGDPDALSASSSDDTIAWYENTDGDGSFGSRQVITSTADGAISVFAADVDGDGDLDVLSAATTGGTIAWHENTDGDGTFGVQQVITSLADGATSVFAADIDGDGDADVLSASFFDDTIAWYENTDGSGSFGPRQTITADSDGAYSVVTADVDGDGDLDVLSASVDDDTVAWHPNRGGQFALGTTDVAPARIANGQLEDVLVIDVTHRGRTGDSPLELQSFELRLTDGAGTALTASQAAALFQTLRVALDEGSGSWEGTETEVLVTSDFSSIITNGNGVLTLEFASDPNVQVAFGDPKRYFVLFETRTDASIQTPSSFDVTHRTQGSSEADDANAGTPLLLEYVANVGTGKIDTQLTSATCQSAGALHLENEIIDTAVTCTAVTVLSTGSSVTVVSPGALTLRAGQKIEIRDGLDVQSGTLDAGVDPGLQP